MGQRKLDVSFGITVKDVPLEELLPVLDQIRQLAGDGTLKLDPQTERLLKRHAPAALPQQHPLALERDAGKTGRALENEGRASDTPPYNASGDDPYTLGELVRVLRIRKGVTQTILTQQAKVSRDYINKIERGKLVPGALICERIVQALDGDSARLHAVATEARIARTKARLASAG